MKRPGKVMTQRDGTIAAKPHVAWRRTAGEVSLPEVHRSIVVPTTASFWRKLAAFSGPGFLVAVGYMDPGNWATDLAGGAQFGYSLLAVIMISNLMAILLQHLVHQARGRHRPRPRPGLPRSLLDTDGLVSLGSLRTRHRRLRSGRGGRLGHRAATSLRHSAGVGLHHHRARCAAGACICKTKAFVTSRRLSSRLSPRSAVVLPPN